MTRDVCNLNQLIMTMHKKTYFSIMSRYILLIVGFRAYASMITSFTKYPTDGIRLLHTYNTQQSSSHLQCLIECSLDSRCLAVNYQLNTLRCELNDNSYNSEIAENWTIYTEPSCDNDWLLYGHSCYLFSTDTVPWLDAVTACQNRNATLVQIERMDKDNGCRVYSIKTLFIRQPFLIPKDFLYTAVVYQV